METYVCSPQQTHMLASQHMQYVMGLFFFFYPLQYCQTYTKTHFLSIIINEKWWKSKCFQVLCA